MKRRGLAPQGFEPFEALRTALGKLPDGLVRDGGPAKGEDLKRAEKQLGRHVPDELSELLGSFDGLNLFHDSYVVAGVGPEAPLLLTELHDRVDSAQLLPGDFPFAETAQGDVFVIGTRGDGTAVFRIQEGSNERWHAGSSLALWIDTILAAEALIYDSDGEFRQEAFEPSGELTVIVGLRQAERALRRDPDVAERQHELGIALRRMDRDADAETAFARAADLQPENPWPAFDLGRTRLAQADATGASRAFKSAALAAQAGSEAGRLWAWAARAAFEAGDRAAVSEAIAAAKVTAPELPKQLAQSAAAAEADGDDEAAAEANALADVFSAAVPLGRRLNVLSAPPPPPKKAVVEKAPVAKKVVTRKAAPARPRRKR